MSRVLTDKSSLVCANQGSVQLTATQSKLRVAGAQVLVTGDLSGAPISGCTTVTDTNTSSVQCLKIASVVGGVSTKLKVSGKGVLLESVKGQTAGTVGGLVQTWSVQSAGQSKLTVS
jgi:hypothetical protein